MLLRLRYHDAAQRPAAAAFVAGAEPAAWLAELGRWGVPAAELACYVVPESVQSVRPAGLLAVAETAAAAQRLAAESASPYGAAAGGRLYLPVHASLWPEATEAELQAALLWPRQLLHPAIGLVGFDHGDRLRLADLLDLGAPRAADWGRAQAAPPARPPLSGIRVEQPTVEELLDSFREEVSSQPLAELPGDKPGGAAEQALDGLRRGALKTGLAAARTLRELLAAASQAAAGGNAGAPGSGNAAPPPAGPGPLERLEQWLAENLDDLERKRQAEIERLLRLFGDNPDEALRFAIPLGGPYFNRGAAPPSARLGPRATDFNLGRLGGGGRVDGWDLGQFQHALRTRYQQAAQREAAAGRFKKAAYIYAHLLADYRAAANVLEQGRFYREAAALYQDHLRQPVAAAECFERGGLLPEAAGLYATLGRDEKAGDLYGQLEQPEQAAAHYEKAAADALARDDYPEAARLHADKLAQPARAGETLLRGWAQPNQPETCLKRYFELVAATAPADLAAQAGLLYRRHTPREKRVSFLHVLAAATEKLNDAALRDAGREVAYEIVSEEAAGNPTKLALLKKFLPDDRLLAADLSRYATARRDRPAPARAAGDATSWQLDPRVRWLGAATHRNQLLALGRRDDQLHLARASWQGHVEYYSWPQPLPPGTWAQLLADAQYGNRVVLRCAENVAFETKRLPKNEHFAEALTVEAPAWLPPWPAGVASTPDGGLAALTPNADESLTLSRYDGANQLVETLTLRDAAGAPDPFEGGPVYQLAYRGGVYYAFSGGQVWVVQAAGASRLVQLASAIERLAASSYTTALTFAFAFSEGAAVWAPAPDPAPDPAPVQEKLLFRVNGSIIDLQFVSQGHLVVASAHEAAVFRYAEAGSLPTYTVEVAGDVVAVLPTADRRRFGLLESSGRLSLHATEPE